MVQPTAVSGISRLTSPGDVEQRDAAEEEEDDESEGASTQVSFQIHFFWIVSRDDVSFLCSLGPRSSQCLCLSSFLDMIRHHIRFQDWGETFAF